MAMSKQIEGCPQPETPIRDRAWTEGQKLSRLRELAERWKRRASLSNGNGDLAFANNKCATELISILDAEGDGVPARSGGVSDADALAHFTEYFVRNYPGPNTIIGNPKWHAPKIFRAAQYAIAHFAKGAEVDGDAPELFAGTHAGLAELSIRNKSPEDKTS